MEIDYQSKISTVVNNIAPSAIRRFYDLANEMKGEVISLSIGEPDFVTPWNIREAGIFSLEDGYTHYSPNQGYIEVRKAISEYLERRFDLKYDPKSQILVTVGGSEALDLIAAHIDELNARIEKRGYSCSSEVSKREEMANIMQEIVDDNKSAVPISISNFDARA